MKHVYFIVCAVTALSSFSVQAASAKSRTSTDTVVTHTTNQYYLNAGAALWSSCSEAMPGIALEITNAVNEVKNLYFGWSFGAYSQSNAPAYALLPMAAKINMVFQTAEKVQTTLGVSAGVAFASAYAETARFVLFFDPGVNINIGKNVDLAVLPRFGVMSSTMVFNPTLGVHLPI